MSSWRDRVIADAADRPTWLTVRSNGIGASDAAGFALEESLQLYVAARLKAERKPFVGNDYTATGNRWEQAALAGANMPQNTLMIRSIDNPRFFATPDSIVDEPDGTVTLGEAKLRVFRDIDRKSFVDDRDLFDPDRFHLDRKGKPKVSPEHRRQIAWAQYCVGPEAVRTKYVVLPYDDRHTPLRMTPAVIIVERDDALIAKLVRIASQFETALDAAHAFGRITS